MCRFSRPVRSVSNTSIFARDAGDEGQILVYSMTLSADEELAMVLAFPVRPGSDERALRFIDLSRCPWIFKALAQGFELEDDDAPSRGLARGERTPLTIVDVGSFEASYVPSIADFDRLDPRFRLPEGVWDEQPSQEGFGFAVFKLKAGNKTVHPMAFAAGEAFWWRSAASADPVRGATMARSLVTERGPDYGLPSTATRWCTEVEIFPSSMRTTPNACGCCILPVY